MTALTEGDPGEGHFLEFVPGISTCLEDGNTGVPGAAPYFAVEDKKKLNHRGTETLRRIRLRVSVPLW
jgi:hypothetical protein